MNQFGIMVGFNKPAAFEGWFSKIDDQENDLMLSVIWGYSTHATSKHAFLQFTHSLEHKTLYIRYPLEQMQWQEHPFVLKIGNNLLSEQEMQLDFEMDGVRVQGSFSFGNLTPIRTSFLKPNIMGWLTYFPNECNHSIISMYHTVNGKFSLGERSWDIQHADGYMEKDWGTSFPKEYVWLHANGWKSSGVVFSYATVPVLGQFAKGFFLVLHHEGEEYRFSSIEGARMLQFDVTKDSFRARIGKGALRIELFAKQKNPAALASPNQGEMRDYIKESLDGRVEISMTKGSSELIRLVSDRASIDVHFNLEESKS
jgi:hypothetical protein